MKILKYKKEWFIKQFENEQEVKYKYNIILCHIPPFIEYWEKEAWHKGEKDWNKFIRDDYVPLFEKYHVDMVISGHSHIYQRGERNGVSYLIIGGGGGNLEVPEEQVEDYNIFQSTKFVHHYLTMELDINSRLNINLYDLQNDLIENFRI